jgi:hypothetical protein
MAVSASRFFSIWPAFKHPRGFLLQREPLNRDRQVAFGIRQGFRLEPLAEIRLPFRLDEMHHGARNEPASGAFGGYAVQHRHGFIRQYDVDAFAHGFFVADT